MYKTEAERIAAAEEQARKYVESLPPETVERLGAANIISDLTHEFLLNGIPSEELAKQMNLLDGFDESEDDEE